MSLKSTVYKAQLQLADIDHGYYADHALTLARHPSETDERMMVRLAALAWNAHHVATTCQGDGQIGFGAGLSDPDDPDVWLRDFTGRTRLWVEVGQPEERPILKACGRADRVVVLCYAASAEIWWRGLQPRLTRPANLEVLRIPAPQSGRLAALAARSMQLQATVQDGTLSLADGREVVEIEPQRWR